MEFQGIWGIHQLVAEQCCCCIGLPRCKDELATTIFPLVAAGRPGRGDGAGNAGALPLTASSGASNLNTGIIHAFGILEVEGSEARQTRLG